MIRIDLGDGDWAELNEKPKHKEFTAVAKAFFAAQNDPSLTFDLAAIAAQQLTIRSSVRGDDGEVVDVHLTPDECPEDKLLLISAKAIEIFQAVKTPELPGAKPSSRSRRAA